MRGAKQFILIAIVLAVAGGGFMLLQATKPVAAQRPVEERDWVVDVLPVQKGDVQPMLRLSGRIVAARDAELRPLVDGRIVDVGPNFRSGGMVQKGDLLVAIDPFSYEAELADSEAALAEANAARAETLAEIRSNRALIGSDRQQEKLRKRDLDRRKRLTGRGVVSQKATDDSNIAYLSARQTRISREQAVTRLQAQAKRLAASIKRAKVRVSRAQWNLERTKLTAPFDGVLTEISGAIGKRVGPNDKLAKIIDNENIEALFHMSDAQYGRLATTGGVAGRPATVVWRAGQNPVRMNATLARTGGEFDAASGGVWVYAPIAGDQNSRGLRPGAYVEAATPDIRYAGVVRVPESAVHGGNRVFILQDGRLAERAVSVLAQDGTSLVITGDLTDGDALVTTRIPEIAPGLKARSRQSAVIQAPASS